MYRNIKTVFGAVVVMGLCACIAYIARAPETVPAKETHEIELAMAVDAQTTTVSSIVAIQDMAQFKELTAKGQNPIMIMVSGKGCCFCKEMKPIFEKIARKYNSKKITFATLNYDIIKLPNIKAFPTILGYKDGQKKVDTYGEKDERDFKNYVQELL